jgi:hypothetical protein
MKFRQLEYSVAAAESKFTHAAERPPVSQIAVQQANPTHGLQADPMSLLESVSKDQKLRAVLAITVAS